MGRGTNTKQASGNTLLFGQRAALKPRRSMQLSLRGQLMHDVNQGHWQTVLDQLAGYPTDDANRVRILTHWAERLYQVLPERFSQHLPNPEPLVAVLQQQPGTQARFDILQAGTQTGAAEQWRADLTYQALLKQAHIDLPAQAAIIALVAEDCFARSENRSTSARFAVLLTPDLHVLLAEHMVKRGQYHRKRAVTPVVHAQQMFTTFGETSSTAEEMTVERLIYWTGDEETHDSRIHLIRNPETTWCGRQIGADWDEEAEVEQDWQPAPRGVWQAYPGQRCHYCAQFAAKIAETTEPADWSPLSDQETQAISTRLTGRLADKLTQTTTSWNEGWKPLEAWLARSWRRSYDQALAGRLFSLATDDRVVFNQRMINAGITQPEKIERLATDKQALIEAISKQTSTHQ